MSDLNLNLRNIAMSIMELQFFSILSWNFPVKRPIYLKIQIPNWNSHFWLYCHCLILFNYEFRDSWLIYHHINQFIQLNEPFFIK